MSLDLGRQLMAENPTGRKLAFFDLGIDWQSGAAVPVAVVRCNHCGVITDIGIATHGGQNLYIPQHQFNIARELMLDFWKLNKTLQDKIGPDEEVSAHSTGD
jgi:hypothetical protein